MHLTLKKEATRPAGANLLQQHRPEFLFIFELAAPPSSLLRQSFRNSQDVIITCDLKLHFSDPHFRDGTSMLAVPITSIPLIGCKSKSHLPG
jgi:hypothetical protein